MERENMFKINGPVLAAVTLDNKADEALRQADAIARFYGVDLHVCHVLPEILAVRPLFPHLHLDDALMVSDLEASARGGILERVHKITGRIASELGVTLEHGTPHSGILRTAERIRAGAIVLGGNQEEEGQAALGRIAEQVVRHAHSPVLVARPSRVGKVLAATDFSDQALPAVQAGVAEAHRRGTDLVLIHAVDLLPPTIPALPPYLAEGIRETQGERLDDCVRQYGARGGGLLPEGLAAPAILRAAEELPAQLLVIGTHGRTGLKRLVLGSVAEAVVRGAHCSVLAVRLAP
jgi:nucleotide-binding universal stress UspA family protein